MSSIKFGGAPLYIIAGIAQQYSENIVKNIQHNRRKSGHKGDRIIDLHGNKSGCHYTKTVIDATLLRIAREVSDLGNRDEPNPSHLTLVFLESQNDSENRLLVDVFYPFAQIYKISKQQQIVYEQQYGNNMGKLIANAINKIPDFSRSAGLPYFYLPLHHYVHPQYGKLFDICLESALNDNTTPPLLRKMIQFETCQPSNCGTCPSREASLVIKDNKKFCFTSNAMHGSHHGIDRFRCDLPKKCATGQLCAQIYLEGLYRFGHPIQVGHHFLM